MAAYTGYCQTSYSSSEKSLVMYSYGRKGKTVRQGKVSKPRHDWNVAWLMRARVNIRGPVPIQVMPIRTTKPLSGKALFANKSSTNA